MQKDVKQRGETSAIRGATLNRSLAFPVPVKDLPMDAARQTAPLLCSMAFVCISFAAAAAEVGNPPLRMVPFHQVRLDDPVWRPRIRMLVRDTLPHAFRNTQQAQEDLRLCAE